MVPPDLGTGVTLACAESLMKLKPVAANGRIAAALTKPRRLRSVRIEDCFTRLISRSLLLEVLGYQRHEGFESRIVWMELWANPH